MSKKTILIIDDSSTIRKMVDSHLTQEGYQVILAESAEKGLLLAPQKIPDLILLDHQLPGTTGIEVCRKIIALPGCEQIPFVVSSTLRKQAYIEYMDVPNVVDSLPKPFKSELLKTTVQNALEVGKMIVSSQTDGTAVPEVVDEVGNAALSGSFELIGLREVLDFLNNGEKSGTLEVELEHDRVWFFLNEGRIQGVVSSSLPPEAVATTLPESMQKLEPLLRFTMSLGVSSHVAGLVDLLDRKLLDPRMLRALLRHQSSILTHYCFQGALREFSFYTNREIPDLFYKAPLQTSLVALLVEGAIHAEEHPVLKDGSGWCRRTLRGQNLDRAGLSPKQIQILNHLDTEPVSTADLAKKMDLPIEEVERTMVGLEMAEWVNTQPISTGNQLIALDPDPAGAAIIRDTLEDPSVPWKGRVVRDEFALQLLLKRQACDLLLVAATGTETFDLPAFLKRAEFDNDSENVVLILPDGASEDQLHESLKGYRVLQRPYQQRDLVQLLENPHTSDNRSPESFDQNTELATAASE